MTAGNPVPDGEDKLPSVYDCMLIPFCRWDVDPLTPAIAMFERNIDRTTRKH